MNIDQAFLCVFTFLDKLFHLKVIKPTDPFDIISIISDMNPDIWKPNRATKVHYTGDPATFDDWLGVVKRMGANIEGSFSSDEVFQGMVAFIEFYQKEFAFKVVHPLSLFSEMKEHAEKYQNLWEVWDESVSYAAETPIRFKR